MEFLGQPVITAYLMSCPERETTRKQTVANLLATDWGEPPRVELDASTADRKEDRQEHTALRLLARALDDAPDFILFLEDDLEFNRHLRHNLLHWYPLGAVDPGGHFFGSIYNPNIHELAHHADRAFFVADPEAAYGSQAFLLSLSTARQIVEHWSEVIGLQDIKMSRLAARVTPIYYHAPSLVQHAAGASTWGGIQHQAADFDAEWRAAPAGVLGRAGLPFLRLPIFQQMRQIDGWLEDEEAEALIVAVERAVRGVPAGRAAAIVEVGSYRGRATVTLGLAARAIGPGRARIAAIDPHEGVVTGLDQGLMQTSPTFEAFRRNIAAAGLTDLVEVIPQRSTDVTWDRPIDLLFIDGLHDHDSVSADFHHFAPWLRLGGLAAFHDYAAHFPGVRRFVDELLADPRFGVVLTAGSLILLQKRW